MARLGDVHRSRAVQKRQRLAQEARQDIEDSYTLDARKAFEVQVQRLLDALQRDLEYLREQGLRYALDSRLDGSRKPYVSLQYLRNATEDIRKILVQYHEATPPVMDKL